MGAGTEFEFRQLQSQYHRLQDDLRRECESHQEDVDMYEQELARLRRALEDSQSGPSGKD